MKKNMLYFIDTFIYKLEGWLFIKGLIKTNRWIEQEIDFYEEEMYE